MQKWKVSVAPSVSNAYCDAEIVNRTVFILCMLFAFVSYILC